MPFLYREQKIDEEKRREKENTKIRLGREDITTDLTDIKG